MTESNSIFYAEGMEKTTMPDTIYPQISATHIKNPNRLYAFPLLGFVLKGIMLIPQIIEMVFLGIAALFIVLVINPFVILFTGTYWDVAYQLNVGIIKLSMKMELFFYGLTNKYPGFDFTMHDDFTVDIKKPTKPSRFLNFPLFGLLIKIVLLIPFIIYEGIMRNAAFWGVFGASFLAFFKGRFPESSYELARDSIRLNISQGMYLSALSDTYPSFWISMNHQTVKIILIILGTLTWLGNGVSGATPVTPRDSYNDTPYSEQNMMRDYTK